MSTPNQFDRREAARQLRKTQADYAFQRPHDDQINNGDESTITDYTSGNLNFLGNFSKGFEHDATTGELTSNGIASYKQLLKALNSGKPSDFDEISLALSPIQMQLVNPQAGIAFDLEGPDAPALTIPPAPKLGSAQWSGEMAELYWIMICRDVSFQQIQSAVTGGPNSQDIAITASTSGSLNWNGYTDLRSRIPVDSNPSSPTYGQVIGQTLFRGSAPGCLIGPYISQFLLIGNEIPNSTYFSPVIHTPTDGYILYGTQVINQKTIQLCQHHPEGPDLILWVNSVNL